MAVILGIDLGTSSVKAMLFDTDRGVLDFAAQSYDVSFPAANCAEQSPDIWWHAAVDILLQLKQRQKQAYESIKAIGFSGQMHGLVVVDRPGNFLRPAIIWLDQRSNRQLEKINRTIKQEDIMNIMHNRPFTGFAFPSLLWIQENEPDVFSKIYKILMPKDYIRLKITGEFGTDVSDASSATGFDAAKRDWAWDILDKMNLPRSIFPACHESIAIAGTVTRRCSEETGLPEGIPVIYGSGDQPAHSVGTGAVQEGLIVSNIGTGGELSAYSKVDTFDSKMRIHTFCHAIDHAYTIFGAHLCSGMSLKWLKNSILHLDDFRLLDTMAEKTAAGSDGLIYLPYLAGSRTPQMDANAKGLFFGMNLNHERRHFVRAVMEGVVFDLKESLDIFDALHISSSKIIACGGGATSTVWLQIQADIFGRSVQVCKEKEQACLGACILAGVGTGLLDNVQNACNQYISMEDKIYFPNLNNKELYSENYEKYKKLYGRVSDLF
ncbi:MAG: xylulokinase [Eubacteriales bacterium]